MTGVVPGEGEVECGIPITSDQDEVVDVGPAGKGGGSPKGPGMGVAEIWVMSGAGGGRATGGGGVESAGVGRVQHPGIIGAVRIKEVPPTRGRGGKEGLNNLSVLALLLLRRKNGREETRQ